MKIPHSSGVALQCCALLWRMLQTTFYSCHIPFKCLVSSQRHDVTDDFSVVGQECDSEHNTCALQWHLLLWRMLQTTFYSCLIPSHLGFRVVKPLCLSTGEPKAQALKCSKEEAHGGGGKVDWHKSLLHSMMQSRFCMIVPGDSQSSERLTDSFVSGLCLKTLRQPTTCHCL